MKKVNSPVNKLIHNDSNVLSPSEKKLSVLPYYAQGLASDPLQPNAFNSILRRL